MAQLYFSLVNVTDMTSQSTVAPFRFHMNIKQELSLALHGMDGPQNIQIIAGEAA